MSVSSDRVTIDAADLEKLNEKDKAELRQFFAGEQKRNRVWARTFVPPFLIFFFGPSRFPPAPKFRTYLTYLPTYLPTYLFTAPAKGSQKKN